MRCSTAVLRQRPRRTHTREVMINIVHQHTHTHTYTFTSTCTSSRCWFFFFASPDEDQTSKVQRKKDIFRRRFSGKKMESSYPSAKESNHNNVKEHERTTQRRTPTTTKSSSQKLTSLDPHTHTEQHGPGRRHLYTHTPIPKEANRRGARKKNQKGKTRHQRPDGAVCGRVWSCVWGGGGVCIFGLRALCVCVDLE